MPMPLTLSQRRDVTAARIVLICLVVCALPRMAAGQTVANVERKLLPLRFGVLSNVPDDFWDALTFVREEEDRQRSLKAEINFGFSGDEAGEQSLFKLNTGISLSRASFPSEVSVASRLQLQLRDGKLQQDVTSLQITYDYHTVHNVEYFAFAERFTDSFMSIAQRYEIGFGARAALRFGQGDRLIAAEPKFDAVATRVPLVAQTLRDARAAAVAAGAPQAAIREVTAAEEASFEGELKDLMTTLEDRETKLLLGLATSVFAEIETAALDVVSVPVDGSDAEGVKATIGLPSTQRYRVSLRPTFKYRPMSDVQILVYPYFKLPIDGPGHVTMPDGTRRFDYRRDVLSELSWTIRSDQTGLENVDFVFTFNHYFDNVPPALPPSVVAQALENGRTFDKTVAERSHSYAAVSLRLRW